MDLKGSVSILQYEILESGKSKTHELVELVLVAV